ncbi:putative glutamine amidotransferase-like protein YfeJ [Paramyrothecium foliicola]|nr:putative glutamine amidotransferase-like protein YfeJ [Paramyrothecium foliicola]
MHVHFIVHESFEAPGAYRIWAETRGYITTYSRLYLGEFLPLTTDSIDVLAEKKFILGCIDAGKAVVGICLGAQLVGGALGASWDKSPEKEIGNFPITLTPAGKSNKKFEHFGSTLQVGHWHNDMPGLTATAKVIASSAGCPRQIVEYTELVYGFQCHMEFTSEVIEALIEETNDELPTLKDHKFVQQPPVLRTNNYVEMNQKLLVFLDGLVDSYVAVRSSLAIET